MKAITTKEFVSLVVIAITAPLLALALVGGARYVAAGNEFLLLALTLCGAVVSGINGFGRRTAKLQSNPEAAAEGHIPAWPSCHESFRATFASFLSTQEKANEIQSTNQT